MLLRALIALLLPAALAVAQAPKDLKATFQDQWKRSQYVEAEATLEAGFKSEPDQALALARSLIETGSDLARPLGAAMFARHASVADLAALAAKLRSTTHPDERRLLVRALGAHAHDKDADATKAVIDAASPFVDDSDLCVAAAAILSLADTGQPDTIGLFINRLVDIPVQTGSPPGGDRGILSRAAAGALDALTERRFKSVNEAKAWWRKEKAADTPADPKADDKDAGKDDPPETGIYGGQKFYATDRFHIFYRIGRTADAPADGDLALDALSRTLDKSAQAAEKVMTPLVGVPHIPVLRLYLCDPQQFNAKAGIASFAGMTTGNEIILKVESPKTLPMTLWHEYIHAVHQSNFDNQPRWISEGLAMSYTLSAKAAMKRDVMDPDMKFIMLSGGFSEMLNWNSGGSGDAKESDRYATAHLCIDYLRFAADRGVPDTRLAFVMGRLSRRQSAKQAIEAVYGMTIKELDKGLRELSGVRP